MIQSEMFTTKRISDIERKLSGSSVFRRETYKWAASGTVTEEKAKKYRDDNIRLVTDLMIELSQRGNV
jgi:hypothetical protein